MTTATAAGVRVTVHDETLAKAAGEAVTKLAADGVPAALVRKDPTLWGPTAAEASIRLDWLDLPRSSLSLLPALDELTTRISERGLDHVVLAGMGGSSLAPQVITETAGAPLTVLDTTDPYEVRRVLDDRLDRTVVVVASKSGTTVETDSHRRCYAQAFRDANLDLTDRFVVVTDPGSPLHQLAKDAGYPVVLAEPNVGGRYSALSAFGLVPSALAGARVAQLLDEAATVLAALGSNQQNPGLLLGAALGAAALAGRDKVVLAETGSGIASLPDWIEQLLAESTGKEGTGLLPVVVEGGHTGVAIAPDVHPVSIGAGGGRYTSVAGPLGAQFLVWEYATAIAGRLLGINPFDQPNVAESKENTAALLTETGEATLPTGTPLFTESGVAVYADPQLLAQHSGGVTDLAGVIEALLATVPEGGYLAVMAYLDRVGEATVRDLRRRLAQRTDAVVTFGWGPRLLHSTGQYHKGGPQRGVFLQLTGESGEDVPVPGRPYTFGELQLAQALGDLRALTGRGRPAVRLHLTDRPTGVAAILAAASRGAK